ncbi:hypothetical protein GPUN_1936 [Glaciecola punicea ACAM 611]|uniref:Uncharacterized protein n=1 Tax=Glaciecola punicea ACAM 611 TaxID=1121923 RepID=H5TCM4_9ALTE|nr:hypothetical protein GPUN_1936 [Glaciecola punicea ACAM 611]
MIFAKLAALTLGQRIIYFTVLRQSFTLCNLPVYKLNMSIFNELPLFTL